MKIKNNYQKELEFKNEVSEVFLKAGLYNIKNIYLTSNLSKMSQYRIKKEQKLNIILNEVKNIMGKDGTIFSPAASMNLCNKEEVFDLKKTSSHQMGPLAEHIRKRSAVRSLHPYWSVCAIGKNARLLKNTSKHAYGVGSPWSILLDLDATQINIGINPERAVTLIHHIETIVGVPYRYNKEFTHKIKINGKIYNEKFYLSTRFKNVKIIKKNKLNKHYFQELKKNKKIKYYKSKNGLEVWSFKMRDFYNVAIKIYLY
jgi:aminoglycoside 3-N-acetyltransferase